MGGIFSTTLCSVNSMQILTQRTQQPHQTVLCMIGDSMVKQTGADRPMFACEDKFSDSKKFITYTINSSETLVKSLDNTPKAFVVHLGTNNLKTSSAIDYAKSVIDLCDSILQKNNENTILSCKVLPRLEGRKVNKKILKFNWEVENHYIDNERVCFSANDNFAKSGSIVERLFRGGNDTVHLSNEGIRLLAGNLTHGLKRDPQ